MRHIAKVVVWIVVALVLGLPWVLLLRPSPAGRPALVRIPGLGAVGQTYVEMAGVFTAFGIATWAARKVGKR